jgi:hypothetical protein
MDKFHKEKNTEFLIPDNMFEELVDIIKLHARNFMKSKLIDSQTRRAVYSSMEGGNRRSYVDKAQMLIDYWGIFYCDTGITIDQIKNIRNKITHEGRYTINDGGQFTKAIKVYDGLMAILVRIFLAMLNYDKYYQDPWLDKWTAFPIRENCRFEPI